MSNNFNVQHYIELMSKKNLNEIEERQLSSYKASVESQITYNRKEEYLLLIKKYLAGKIDPHTFRADFLTMQKQDTEALEIMEKNLEQLSSFSIDFGLKEEKFPHLIDLTYDSSILAFELGPEEGISDQAFQVSIENAFLKFRE